MIRIGNLGSLRALSHWTPSLLLSVSKRIADVQASVWRIRRQLCSYTTRTETRSTVRPITCMSCGCACSVLGSLSRLSSGCRWEPPTSAHQKLPPLRRAAGMVDHQTLHDAYSRAGFALYPTTFRGEQHVCRLCCTKRDRLHEF